MAYQVASYQTSGKTKVVLMSDGSILGDKFRFVNGKAQEFYRNAWVEDDESVCGVVVERNVWVSEAWDEKGDYELRNVRPVELRFCNQVFRLSHLPEDWTAIQEAIAKSGLKGIRA